MACIGGDAVVYAPPQGPRHLFSRRGPLEALAPRRSGMTATYDLAVGLISGGRQLDCGPRLSDGAWDGNVEALAGLRVSASHVETPPGPAPDGLRDCGAASGLVSVAMACWRGDGP